MSATPSMTSRIVLETKYGKIIRATPQTSGTTVLCRLPYTKKPSPIEPNSNPQRRDDVSNPFVKRLTVKLRGRTEVPGHGAEGAQFLSARGAKPQAHHGTLQRLLGAGITKLNNGARRTEFRVERSLPWIPLVA